MVFRATLVTGPAKERPHLYNVGGWWCSSSELLSRVSERLRAGVKHDVERRNALVGFDDGSRFADFTAILTLDPAGQCRFVVGEALYAEWEVRRMALELLFFDEPGATE